MLQLNENIKIQLRVGSILYRRTHALISENHRRNRCQAVHRAQTNIRQNRLVRLPARQQSAISAVHCQHHVLQAQVWHVVRQSGRPSVSYQQHSQLVRGRKTSVLGRTWAHMESLRRVSETGRKGEKKILPYFSYHYFDFSGKVRKGFEILK